MGRVEGGSQRLQGAGLGLTLEAQVGFRSFTLKYFLMSNMCWALRKCFPHDSSLFSPQSRVGGCYPYTCFTDKKMKAQRHPAISSRTQNRTAGFRHKFFDARPQDKTGEKNGTRWEGRGIQVAGKGEHLYYVSTSQALWWLFRRCQHSISLSSQHLSILFTFLLGIWIPREGHDTWLDYDTLLSI